MKRYLNKNGNSNVNSYEIGGNYIEVLFNGTSKIYKYSYRSAGMENIETMKKLATNGSGLNSYINTHVKYMYEK